MRRLAAALFCTLPITLVACGGDDADDRSDVMRQIEQEIEQGGGDTPDSGGSDAPSGAAEPPAPEFSLMGDVDPPAGWVEDPSSCQPDEPGPPLFSYYVPAEWDRTGSGSGGGGGTSGGGNHSYNLPEGPSLEIEIDNERLDQEGTPLDFEGEPWESWDYDITSYSSDSDGEESFRATYEELDPLDVDGETVDLWYLDQSQSDLISSSEYKLRLVFAQVPTGGAGNGLKPQSAEVTVAWDADDGDLDEDDIREVLGSFRLDECARDMIVSSLEMLHGTEW